MSVPLSSKTVIEKLAQYIANSSIAEIKKSYERFWRYYENNEPLLEDVEFDYFVDLIRKTYPEQAEFTYKTGVISGKDKIQLPYLLPSLGEKKDDAAIGRWINAYPSEKYIVMAKLDGISAEWIPSSKKLYKRGNGVIGNDISRFVPHLQGLHDISQPRDTEYVFRGEIMMDNSCDLLTDESSLARNIVAGIFNRKDKGIEDAKKTKFVVYEIVNPPNISPILQIQLLMEAGFEVPLHKFISTDELKGDFLSGYFDHLKNTDSRYDYDGVVVVPDIARNSNFVHEIKDGDVVLPKDKFKWKTPGELKTYDTQVTHVEWNVQDTGKLIPVVWFEPVEVLGATIRKAAGHNAELIAKNKIGPGAIISVHRSNDTIPKIYKVVKEAETASMPDKLYTWNGVHIYQTEETDGQKTAQLKKTLDALEVENIGPSIVDAMFKSHFQTVHSVYNATAANFAATLPHCKEAGAQKIYQGLRVSRDKWNIVTFMIASRTFPSLVGKSKLNILMNQDPKWKQWKYDTFVNSRPKGLSLDTIQAICGSLNDFKEWYMTNRDSLLDIDNDEHAEMTADAIKDKFYNHYDKYDELLMKDFTQSKISTPDAATADSSTPKTVRIIVPSGFRFNDELKQYLRPGDVIEDNVTKNTNYVVYRSAFKDTAKTEKAKKYGIQIVDLASL